MGRSSFVFGLGSIVNFGHCFLNHSREVFRELQDRPILFHIFYICWGKENCSLHRGLCYVGVRYIEVPFKVRRAVSLGHHALTFSLYFEILQLPPFDVFRVFSSK